MSNHVLLFAIVERAHCTFHRFLFTLLSRFWKKTRTVAVLYRSQNASLSVDKSNFCNDEIKNCFPFPLWFKSKFDYQINEREFSCHHGISYDTEILSKSRHSRAHKRHWFFAIISLQGRRLMISELQAPKPAIAENTFFSTGAWTK